MNREAAAAVRKAGSTTREEAAVDLEPGGGDGVEEKVDLELGGVELFLNCELVGGTPELKKRHKP